MKKLFAVLSLTVILCSCKKNLNTDNSAPLPPPETLATAGDGAWDLLGFGYNVTGDYGTSDASTFPVVDVARLVQEQPTYIIASGAETSTVLFEVGLNAEDYIKKITAKTKLRGGAGFLFKGVIDANFSQEDKWSSKFIYGSYSNLIIKRRVRMIADADFLKNYLHQGFLDHVQNYSPALLVSTYGTHVLTDIRLGGRIELIYQSQTTSSERIIAAGAGVQSSFFGVFNQNTSGTYDETAKANNFNESVTARTIGGASQTTIKGISFNANGTPSAAIDVSAWGAGVTDQNAELVQISEEGAIPLYDLIADPVKKAAVKAYIDQYLLDNAVRLTYSTDPNANYFSTFDGMGDHAEGSGVVLTDLNGNQVPDAIFMVNDAPQYENAIKYKIGYDITYGVPTSTSNVKTVTGLGDHCEGSGIAIGDIDKNGIPDIILMAYDAPNGPNNFRYKVGFNLNANGDAAYWTSGKSISGIADAAKGAGICLGDIDNNGTLDLILMAYDIPSGSTQIRYKVGYNLNSSGDAVSWSATRGTYGMADNINGCATTLTDIDNNGTLDLVVLVEDDPYGENRYKYKIGYNINAAGIVSYWGNVIEYRAPAHFSEGTGIAFGNLDANPAKDILLMSLDAPTFQNTIMYKIGFNVNSLGQTSHWQ